MLKKKWPRKIISDEGFEVQIESQGRLIYREGKKELSVNSELLAENAGIVIYKDSIKQWTSCNENSAIDLKKQQVILDNLVNALDFKKIKTQII